MLKTDSLSIVNHKIDSLSNLLHDIKIGESYFSEIISSQTAIFGLIVSILIGIAGVISWLTFFRRYDKRLKAFETFKNSFEVNYDKIKELEKTVLMTKNHALRSLYEGSTHATWKIIWHIRYSEWFLDTENITGLKLRLEVMDAEYQHLKSRADDYRYFLNFDNIGGIKVILQKLCNHKDPGVYKIPMKILSEILAFQANTPY
jgi:hypothetical protein